METIDNLFTFKNLSMIRRSDAVLDKSNNENEIVLLLSNN